MRDIFWIHGLGVASTVALPAPIEADRAADRDDLDIAVVRGDLPALEGTVLAHVDDDRTGRHFTLSGDSDGWVLLFHGAASVRISQDLSRARVTAAHGTSDALLSVLLGGPTLVVVSVLAGRPMLHASAVLTSRGVIAFVGPSGAGKSTLARLTSERTRPLFSDDALRVDVAGGEVIAHRGTTASRLRARADQLSGGGTGEVLSTSADGRTVLIADEQVPPVGRLALIALPRLSPRFETPRLVSVAKLPAVLELAGACALDGMRNRRLLTAQFDLAGELVDRVPVVELQVPWPGGHLPRALGSDLAAVLASALPSGV